MQIFYIVHFNKSDRGVRELDAIKKHKVLPDGHSVPLMLPQQRVAPLRREQVGVLNVEHNPPVHPDGGALGLLEAALECIARTVHHIFRFVAVASTDWTIVQVGTRTCSL